MRPSLAVVIVSYRTPELLRRCLASLGASLAASPEIAASVWVVDNASGDGSAEMVAAEFPQVRLLALPENVGFVRANNLALRQLGFAEAGATSPDFVFLLNPDTELPGHAPAQLLGWLQTAPEAGLVGPKLLNPDGSLQHGAFVFPSLWQILLDFFPLHGRLLESRLNGRYPRRWYAADDPFAADFVLGAAMMARGEAVRRVGLLDERFFMYCEEIDWCRRFWEAGWSVHCLPQAEVLHHGGASTGQFRDTMFVTLWRSRFLLFQKWASPAFLWAARRLVRLGLWAAERRARAAARRGALSAQELAERLHAYRQVARL
ncbi:MAG: glycosyltransferase family 2 protein [Chloroflexi bacterium]|nr:glycosyltransferase family 2 protein [Chloroflexota bacterium]